MRRILIGVIIVVGIVIGYFVYVRWHARNDLNVDPHAREQIEKAKHR